jgi:hypothetical protein
VLILADGRPGAPRKPEGKKKITFNYTMDKEIGEQLNIDAQFMGEKASNVVAEFSRRYHESTEDIEVQKLILQQKIVDHKRLTIEIEEDQKRIGELEKIITVTKKRGENPEYMADLHRHVDRLIAYPKEQSFIPERANVIAINHGYYRPLIIRDITEAIRRSNGHGKVMDKKPKMSAEATV